MSQIALPIAELKPALIGLGKVLNRKTTLPVLACVKVERTEDGWTTLTVTDLDRCATVRLEQPAEGDPCTFLVPYEDLQKTAKACTKGDSLYLEPGGDGEVPFVTLKYPIGKQLASSKIYTVPVEEFPETPRVKGEPIPLPDNLRTAIHEGMECASDDETRFVLNGVYIDVSQPACHQVVGTNGRMLYASNSFSLPLTSSFILPSHTFLGWKEFNSDGEWQLKHEPNPTGHSMPIEISTRRWRYISKQVDGNYPNWRQVVPKSEEFKTKIVVDEGDIESILQIIQRLPNDDLKDFRIGVKVHRKRVSLLGRAPQADSWTEIDIPTRHVSGKEILIYVNREFFPMALKFGLNTLETLDEMSPMKLSHGGRQFILMPVRGDAATKVQEKTESATAEPVNSEPDAQEVQATATVGVTEEPEPATEPNSQSAEPATMVNDISTPAAATEGATTTTTEQQQPINDIDAILETVEDLKESLSTNLTDLKMVTGKLRQMKKDQKSVEREMQSFRSTLEKLQTVRL